MRATRSEQTLRRVLAWLRWTGHELGPRLEQAALQALAEAVAAEEADLFGATLRRLRDSAGLMANSDGALLQVGPACPPLRRSSIGYGSY